MHIKTRPLYRKTPWRVPRHIRAIVVLLAIVSPVLAIGVEKNLTQEQDFILTAYYSPMPGQCCYVRGGYRADKILNGEGVRGADGTAVYPGMIAAPSTYAFGTVVTLPGIGRFTVHDRGGAINELPGGAHRLDLWVGYGEEGLARALAFGVRKVRGTVYDVGGFQPKERFSFETLPAVLDRLEIFQVRGQDLLAMKMKAGDRGLSVELLQRSLKQLGFFSGSVTGLYGTETQESVRAFQEAYGLEESADALSERSAAMVMAAVRRAGATPPVIKNVEKGTREGAVRTAQRTLRFLGFYTGRTDGRYDDDLASAILRYQQKKGLVGTAEDPGAGRIGPLTRKQMVASWNRRLVTALSDRLLTLYRVGALLDERGGNVDQFLETGDSGDQVTLLQRLLSERGYFPEEKINGHFGEQTMASVIAYQKAQKLIVSASDAGAGTVGPQTLMSLRSDERREAYLLVRREGWKAL